MAQKNYTAIVHSLTPFDAKFQIDEEALRLHLRRLRDAGVAVYLGASGAAEGHTLNREERDRMLEIAVEELKGRVPVRAAGCEQHTTAEMIEFVQSAERIKVDAAQIYSLDMGHGVKPTPREVENYFRSVIESTALPVVISNQVKVGYSLSFDLIERLVNQYPHIIGFAYDAKDTAYMVELVRRFGDRLEVHCSGPDNALFTLGIGGNGYQGMDGNVAPKLYNSIIEAFKANDLAAMHAAFSMFMRLRIVLRGTARANMRAIKPLLNAFGLPGGYLRPPRLPISSAELDEVIRAVLDLRIPEMADWTLPHH